MSLFLSTLGGVISFIYLYKMIMIFFSLPTSTNPYEEMESRIRYLIPTDRNPMLKFSISQAPDFPCSSFKEFKEKEGWYIRFNSFDMDLLKLFSIDSPFERMVSFSGMYIKLYVCPFLLIFGVYASSSWWFLLIAPFWLFSSVYGTHFSVVPRILMFSILLVLTVFTLGYFLDSRVMMWGSAFAICCMIFDAANGWYYRYAICDRVYNSELALMLALSRRTIFLNDENYNRLWEPSRLSANT